MKLLQWNIQWCRGMDGRVDPARIARATRRLCDADVVCFQEVADNFATLAGSAGENQPALLAAQFPGYSAHFACAVDVPDGRGGRRRFGNMILSRLPVRQVFRHLLPFPAEHGVRGMPRIAVEAVVGASFGDVRVITAHLEWYSQRQRSAQVQALRAIYAEGHAHARSGLITDESGGPFTTHLRPAATIICGDFNLEPTDPDHGRMLAPFTDGTPPLTDCWELTHPGKPHPSTFCIYNKMQPDGPELHCDFIFVSEELKPRVRSLTVDQKTQASDHQPLVLDIG
jgi:endonuclease/exonuclease/phosphatase family metal-dependent hydrolase